MVVFTGQTFQLQCHLFLEALCPEVEALPARGHECFMSVLWQILHFLLIGVDLRCPQGQLTILALLAGFMPPWFVKLLVTSAGKSARSSKGSLSTCPFA
jgi:hypothetical protein